MLNATPDISITYSNLLSLMVKNFPRWCSRPGNIGRLDRLSTGQIEALHSLLLDEISSEVSFKSVIGNIKEYEMFNFELNEIAGELIDELMFNYGANNYKSIESKNRIFAFQPLSTDLVKLIDEVKFTGYSIAPERFSNDLIDKIYSVIEGFKFQKRQSNSQPISGLNLLNKVFDPTKDSNEFKGTYWLMDQNKLVHDPLMFNIAFDPQIISVVGGILGCPPIHVQTNVWFSFPSTGRESDLSESGQQYHQDKDFIKFVKVFVYLNNVTHTNGAHSYIMSSHIDDLCSKGVPYSDRVSDECIVKYYDRSRIKKITGERGTVIYGDTSCAHKGEPVMLGSRLILQLEYASSLFNSATSPFEDLTLNFLNELPYNKPTQERLTQNYSSSLRARFQQELVNLKTKRSIFTNLRYKFLKK